MMPKALNLCLCFLVSFVLASNHGPKHEKRVVCNLVRWSIYLNGRGKFDIKDAEPAMSMCTHVVYHILTLDENTNKIDSPNEDYDFKPLEGGLAKMVVLRQKYPHLKVMVAVGGWEDGSEKYSKMVSNQDARKTFIQSVVELLSRFGLNGLDIMWQSPGERGGTPDDKKNFVLLIQEMRNEFDKHDFIISVDVSGLPYRIDLGIDAVNLAKHAHFLNLLAYEYHGYWEEKVGASAPLHGKHNLSVEASVNLYRSLGVPADKLNLGISTLGLTYYLLEEFSDDDDDIEDIVGRSAKNFAFKGTYTDMKGFMGYNEICLEVKDPSWKVMYDPVGHTKFAIKGDKVISFDDAETYEEKVKFAMEKNLGGIMYYTLDRDDFQSDCGTQKFPILHQINSVLKESSDGYNDLQQLISQHNASYFWNLGDNN